MLVKVLQIHRLTKRMSGELHIMTVWCHLSSSSGTALPGQTQLWSLDKVSATKRREWYQHLKFYLCPACFHSCR